MKVFIYIFILSYSNLFSQAPSKNEKLSINQTLDAWHNAAAEANFDLYFSYMTSTGVFIGTDASENWQNAVFKTFSKPFFDKGKAWSFKSVQRNVYISKDRKTAWFDELLDTQMKICRGSGVLLKQKGKWKIAHYVLSIAIPNQNSDEVVKIKSAFDDAFLKNIK